MRGMAGPMVCLQDAKNDKHYWMFAVFWMCSAWMFCDDDGASGDSSSRGQAVIVNYFYTIAALYSGAIQL